MIPHTDIQDGELWTSNRNSIFRAEGQAAERLHVATAIRRHRSRAGLGVCDCGPRPGRTSFGVCLWSLRIFRDGTLRAQCSIRALCGANYRGSYVRDVSSDIRFARMLRNATPQPGTTVDKPVSSE